jgi:hypothetical protein
MTKEFCDVTCTNLIRNVQRGEERTVLLQWCNLILVFDVDLGFWQLHRGSLFLFIGTYSDIVRRSSHSCTQFENWSCPSCCMLLTVDYTAVSDTSLVSNTIRSLDCSLNGLPISSIVWQSEATCLDNIFAPTLPAHDGGDLVHDSVPV